MRAQLLLLASTLHPLVGQQRLSTPALRSLCARVVQLTHWARVFAKVAIWATHVAAVGDLVRANPRGPFSELSLGKVAANSSLAILVTQ